MGMVLAIALKLKSMSNPAIGATQRVLKQIKDALFSECAITSADGTRFLGMDVHYDLPKGVLTFSMGTRYLHQVHRRPFRKV